MLSRGYTAQLALAAKELRMYDDSLSLSSDTNDNVRSKSDVFIGELLPLTLVFHDLPVVFVVFIIWECVSLSLYL